MFIVLYDPIEKMEKAINLASVDYIQFNGGKIEFYIGGYKIEVYDNERGENAAKVLKHIKHA